MTKDEDVETLRAHNADLAERLARAEGEIRRLSVEQAANPKSSGDHAWIPFVIVGAVLFGGGVGAATFLALRHAERATDQERRAPVAHEDEDPPAPEPIREPQRIAPPPSIRDEPVAPSQPGGPKWEGVHAPVLVSLHGDGGDVVGRVERGQEVHIAAFDGQSGALLWESQSLGSYADTYSARLVVDGKMAFFGSAHGDLTALSLRDGAKLWSAKVSETVKTACTVAGDVSFTLSDGSIASFVIASGAPAPTPQSNAGCEVLQNDEEDSHIPNETDLPHVEGMRPERKLARAAGPTFVIGTRDVGTRVPTIAAVFGDHSRDWKSNLAADDPLTSKSLESPLVINETGAYSIYFRHVHRYRLVGFDTAGRRLFDVEVPGDRPFSALRADARNVYTSEWGLLTAFDPATGNIRFQVGHDPSK